MWVSILQNGRKKDSDNHINQMKQLIKLSDKSTVSASLSKTSALTSSRVQNTRENGFKQIYSIFSKQNQFNGTPRLANKNRINYSTANLLANKNSLFNNFSNTSDNSIEPTKKIIYKSHEHSFAIVKPRSSQQELTTEYKAQTSNVYEDKNNAYLLKHLGKKNKIRSQLNMNIHNSIYTFKQFVRACQFAQPKPIDIRVPLQVQGRKTIVFDMDQTLIHTNQSITPNYQIKVPFRSFQGRIGYGFVQVRPHCKQILKRLSQHFDIILFTASTQAYADPIIDHIDPDRVIQARLYRQSCSFIKNQIFVKDLRVLGRKLSNVVLVDNAPYSYLMQLQNGIPIIPYYRGKQDEQLLCLQSYLMKLKEVDDVRSINKNYFKLHQYGKFDSHDKLINKLYGQWVK